MADTVSRSWFAVFPYPEKHGYTGTPEEIIDRLKREWIEGNKLRKGFWAYCVSAEGMPHVHMVLESSGSMRFSAVKKAYPQAHLEPTKGSKQQVIAYMKKEPPFDEKGEQVLCFVSHGNIEGNKRFALPNMNETLNAIEQLVEEGMTPNQIMEEDIRLRREESLVRKAYFAKRYRETPPYREVKVIWHIGDSGSGKTFAYVTLCEQYGDENVYLCTDYANRGASAFDGYCGEPILFLDELKGDSLPFGLLLTIMQGYRTQLHCRYANCYALWNEIHITSIYAPEDIYAIMVNREEHAKNPVKQLLRRISAYIYHYYDNGQYKAFELDGKLYRNYSELKILATGEDGFIKAKDEEIPFRKG